MKVIAKVDHKKYICEISHEEIEKFMALYYDGGLKELNVGAVVDLGEGQHQLDATKRALKETQQFFKNNADTIKAITNAFLLTNEKE